MATGVLPPDTTLEFHLVTLFEKLEAARLEAACAPGGGAPSAALRRPSMQAEVRTLEFWRSIISECLASFFYVFIVCGGAAAAVSGPAAGGSPLLLTTAIATGLAVATLTHCFGHISGEPPHTAATRCVSRRKANWRRLPPFLSLVF
ncbi:neurogenic protein big brain-like [Schistocerca piceifrons]|uniref:neurogenic protein big brain-like n=1 Tax=Schistocerca piceifrons TaxID=274613 RepID=UPI001F5FBE5C|nr:neurogenic protein big brain-like [Schistocerca piceifrons]